jgi:hypothetical protein
MKTLILFCILIFCGIAYGSGVKNLYFLEFVLKICTVINYMKWEVK